MNAILFTVLALSGADASLGYGPAGGDAAGYCDQCDACGAAGHDRHHCNRGGCLGPMPQSCYNPSFGCYPSTRYMNRYPAFHNTYYRAAYNYRQYFDYPWHAGLHEPTSMFSYHTPGATPAAGIPTPAPDRAGTLLPTPARSAGGLR
jgi:hypothetical protein